MIEAAYAGMFVFGIYGTALILSMLIGCGWSDSSWKERIGSGFVVLFFFVFFVFFWMSKNEVLKRHPVISSCVKVVKKFFLVDSTLRCKSGEEPRYTVMKEERKMIENEQSACENCGKTMIHHFDISCVKTDKELKSEALIDWMNAPL